MSHPNNISSTPYPLVPCEIDERWVADWLVMGFQTMERFLARHNAFRTFYESQYSDDVALD